MIFKPSLDEVVAFCQKPECERTFLHRHHVRHAALWINLKFKPEKRKGWSYEKLLEMEKRYKLFHPDDIIWICSWHHAEIHLIYDTEIEKHQRAKHYKALG